MTERAALMLFLSLLAGAAAHFALRRAGRRLPRALARRRGVMLAGSAPTPRALAAWTRRNLPEALEGEAPATAAADAAVDPKASDLSELGPEDWSDVDLAAVAEEMRGPMGVPVEDRRHLLSLYRRCFVASEAVDWLADHAGLTRSETVAVGQRLVDLGCIRHVLAEHGFRDGHFFLRFREDEAEAA